MLKPEKVANIKPDKNVSKSSYLIVAMNVHPLAKSPCLLLAITSLHVADT
jgi:protein-S-isoprenylcysteine O-methyltransferase Ste14